MKRVNSTSLSSLTAPLLNVYFFKSNFFLYLSFSETVHACFHSLGNGSCQIQNIYYLDLLGKFCSFLYKHLVGVPVDDRILVVDVGDGDFQLCAAGLVLTVSGLQGHGMQGSDLAIQQSAVSHNNRACTGIHLKVRQSETQLETVEWRGLANNQQEKQQFCFRSHTCCLEGVYR